MSVDRKCDWCGTAVFREHKTHNEVIGVPTILNSGKIRHVAACLTIGPMASELDICPMCLVKVREEVIKKFSIR